MNLKNVILKFLKVTNFFAVFDACDVHRPSCSDDMMVCPKYTEISCNTQEGIDGYTTYKLSLDVQPNKNIENIFALYGDDHSYSMYIPPAYQIDGPFDTDLGGISPSIISIYPDAFYDSWITIGITDGDKDNKLSTIGIDFHTWDDRNPIITDNGAIFLMDPTEIISEKEYIIGQLTLNNNNDNYLVINVDGKKNVGHGAWSQSNVRFDFRSKSISQLPDNCLVWYNGCNICYVNNNVIGECSDEVCDIHDNPECRIFTTEGSGH